MHYDYHAMTVDKEHAPTTYPTLSTGSTTTNIQSHPPLPTLTTRTSFTNVSIDKLTSIASPVAVAFGIIISRSISKIPALIGESNLGIRWTN
eukprot:scaffold74416_cov41-Cyclotella_meneghiniana.AAC.2